MIQSDDVSKMSGDLASAKKAWVVTAILFSAALLFWYLQDLAKSDYGSYKTAFWLLLAAALALFAVYALVWKWLSIHWLAKIVVMFFVGSALWLLYFESASLLLPCMVSAKEPNNIASLFTAFVDFVELCLGLQLAAFVAFDARFMKVFRFLCFAYIIFCTLALWVWSHPSHFSKAYNISARCHFSDAS